MAFDIRIYFSIFILIGASADGCGVALGFATSLLKVAGKAPGDPPALLGVHGHPKHPEASMTTPNPGEMSALERGSHECMIEMIA